MGDCGKCGSKEVMLYGGVCAPCLSHRAAEAEKKKLDKESDLQGVVINTPLSFEETLEIMTRGQGNFGTAHLDSEEGMKKHLCLDEKWCEKNWDSFKKNVINALKKYEQELKSFKYNYCMMENIDINKTKLVENVGGIAIYEVNKKGGF